MTGQGYEGFRNLINVEVDEKSISPIETNFFCSQSRCCHAEERSI
jgi:hypothetical protein